MRALVVRNDPPYGTERSYNGLRLANALAKREQAEVRLFLMGDAVACAVGGQQTPNGYYNLERMLKAAAAHGVEIGCCGTRLDARGIPTRCSSTSRTTRRSSSSQTGRCGLSRRWSFERHRWSAALLNSRLPARGCRSGSCLTLQHVPGHVGRDCSEHKRQRVGADSDSSGRKAGARPGKPGQAPVG